MESYILLFLVHSHIILLYFDYNKFVGQVFDLNEETPDKVLQRIYLNLERLNHDALACKIKEKLKIIVC